MTLKDKVERYRTNFPLFAEEQLRIITKKDGLQPFILNRMQRHVWNLFEQRISNGQPVRAHILKARQLGSSTIVQAIAFWRTVLWAYQNALTVSHEETSASSLFSKQQVFYNNIDTDLRPNIRRSNRAELYFTGSKPGQKGLESRHLIATANNRNLGASQTLHFLHMSEYARYEALLQDINLTMASVLPTVPYAAGTFIIIETTAQGLGHFKEKWDAEDDYLKIFVSWIADESYTADEPLPISEIQRVDSDPWGNEEVILEQVHRELETWYADKDEEWRQLEALKRLKWRRLRIQNEFAGNRGLFKQEYPITAEEAFITSGQNVFSPLKLGDLMSLVESQNYPLENYRFDSGFKEFYPAPYGHLRVYEPPRRNVVYVIGADSSYGLDKGDYAGAHVLRLPEFDQVAVFQDRIEPDEFGELLHFLGLWYNTAAICPETFGAGMATVLKLQKDLLYPNLYTREAFDKTTNEYKKTVGFMTTQSTKPVLISDLLSAFHNDLVRFRDMETLKEMSFFTEKNGKFNAESGKHDDLVMSLGLALQMARQVGFVTRTSYEQSLGPGTIAYEVKQNAMRHDAPWRL